MPITAYTGLPRHGKSYGVVENVIAPALKKKRKIFTNIPMKNEECLKRFGCTVVQFDVKDIIENDNWFTEVFEKGAMLVADELWELWPAGMKANNAKDQHKEFLAKHGHLVGEDGYATNIVFITQDLSQIAAFARCLVETTYIVEKLIAVGSSKRYRVDIFSGSITGLKPPVSKRQREIFGTFKKETFDLYVSHTDSDAGAGDEELIDKRFNIMGGAKIKLIIAGLFVFVMIAIFAGYHFYKTNVYTNPEKSNSQSSKVKSIPIEQSKSSIKQSALQDSPQIKQSALQDEKKKPKELDIAKVNDVLSQVDSIYVVGSIVRQAKEDKKEIYQYKILIDETFSYLSKKELINLGYTVTIINPCLTTITGYEKAYYALCDNPDIKTNGFVTVAN